MFYAVLALAVFKDEILSKHTHAISFFDKEFVKTRILPKELSRALHYLFDERQSSDYGEITEIDFAEAQSALSSAQEFVRVIETYLANPA